MWERALAAERSVRLGHTISRIHWTITVERILVWLRLAEAQDRDVTTVDRARRRARLGRARLRLHLLHEKRAATWRIRHAHNRVIRYAMHAADHLGLADSPGAADEREALQIYLATLYGVVEATSPEAVARFDAWRLSTNNPPEVSSALHPYGTTEDEAQVIAPAEPVYRPVPGGSVDLPTATAAADDQPQQPRYELRPAAGSEEEIRRDLTSARWPAGVPETEGRSQPPASASRDPYGDDHDTDEEADRSAVAAMRRFWNSEIAHGRVPTGAELSRAAGVPPSTGLGRRKRREWQAELPKDTRITATTGR